MLPAKGGVTLTTLTIGDLKVEATEFDQKTENIRLMERYSDLPKYVQVLVRHFGSQSAGTVVSYDCKTRRWTRKRVDANFNFHVRQEMKIVGVDPATGKPTRKDTLALVDRYVAPSRLGNRDAFGQKLHDLFGRHTVPVPSDGFAQKWAPRYSFDIDVRVEWHVLRLFLRGQDKRSWALLGIPFEVSFVGIRTFDCETKRTYRFRLLTLRRSAFCRSRTRRPARALYPA